MGKLTNKVAVVTGAAKGIGASIAKHLAAEGASVVVNYASDEKGANQVVSDITHAGGEAIAVQASVAVETEVISLFEQTAKVYGRVDILINNAGVYAFAPIENLTSAEFSRQFNTNVLALLLATKTALPLFPEAGGNIVNLSSVVSTAAPATASIYAATKGAVDTINETEQMLTSTRIQSVARRSPCLSTRCDSRNFVPYIYTAHARRKRTASKHDRCGMKSATRKLGNETGFSEK